MKPLFERVTFPKGCSLRVYHRQVQEIPFEWHHHPEYELTLTLNSKGWRFIGDHIGQYRAPDLVLVPPDLPHTWASTASLRSREPHIAIVIWFSAAWLTQFVALCPEYSAIRGLLRRSSGGLAFNQAAAEHFAGRAKEVLAEQPTSRLQATLELLLELAEAPATSLSTNVGSMRPSYEGEPAQLTRVLNHLHKHFHEKIQIDLLCQIGNLSPRSLHRLFVRHIGESVSNYLSRLRIARACMRLVETNHPVSLIAGEVGLPNLANFNRHFRHIRQMTPTAYRESIKRHGALPDPKRISEPQDLSQRPVSLAGQRKKPPFKMMLAARNRGKERL